MFAQFINTKMAGLVILLQLPGPDKTGRLIQRHAGRNSGTRLMYTEELRVGRDGTGLLP